MLISPAWHRSLSHEAHHLIINGEAACKTAKIDRWGSWLLVKQDEMDTSKQCTRCKHHAVQAEAPPTAPPPPFDRSAFFRELGRRGGQIGGRVSSPAKARAARLREARRRNTKRLGAV